MARRRFRCLACGRKPPPGQTVALQGLVVMRRRRVVRRGLSGWEEVAVMATPAYPARACRACAGAFPRHLVVRPPAR